MSNIEGIPERLKDLRSRLSLTQKKMAELLRCSQAKVSDYESGKLSVSNSDLFVIANTYNVNLHWLITGEGDMYIGTRTREGLFSHSLRLPVLGDIAAGMPQEIYLDEPTEYIDLPTDLLSLPPPYYVFTVDGESMLPVIHPGDYVVISSGAIGVRNNHLDGRICAFRTADGITLKQYAIDTTHKTAWLWPINSRYHPIHYAKDTTDLTLVGVLVLSIRKY